jgi:hypothetical protein
MWKMPSKMINAKMVKINRRFPKQWINSVS